MWYYIDTRGGMRAISGGGAKVVTNFIFDPPPEDLQKNEVYNMRMVYGGYLPVSGVFTDKKGKEIDWKNIKILLSADGSRAGLYKAPYSEEFIELLRSLPADVLTDVSFDFYGNVESLRRVEGGTKHD